MDYPCLGTVRLFAGCSVVALAIGSADASAQTDPQANQPAPAAGIEVINTTSPAPSDDGAIIVTGSRISRRDFASESPIVTIGQKEIGTAGSPTLESALTQLPQLSTSAGASSSYRGRGGQASANLRGLGQQRTLVLIDGRRVQPASPDGSIDLNVIPPMLVESIETITGGASATYGSDAVTGVINIKLRKNVTGLELSTQSGISDRGDAGTRDFGALLGGKFSDDRGHAYLSFNYSGRDSAKYTSRDYLSGQALSNRLVHAIVNLNASNLPSQAAINSVFAGYGIAAGTVSRSSALLGANADGTLFTQNGAVNFRDLGTTSEQIYNKSVYNSVGNAFVFQTKMKRYNATAGIDYDLTPSLTAYGQFLFTDYTVTLPQTNLVYGAGTQPVQVSMSNPFIPADLRTILESRPDPTADFTIARGIPELGVVTEQDHYTTYQLTGGLKGTIADRGWNWDVYASYGSTRLQAKNYNYISYSGIQSLLGSATGGTEYCDGGYNPFSQELMSDDCADYLRRNPTNITTLSQFVMEGSISGPVATLPAGQLSIALGADFRRNGYNFDVDPSISANDVAYYFPIFGSQGHTSVAEFFGEALVPLLRDLPGINMLSLNLAYRFSRYNISGSTHTYKASADWAVIPEIRLRGGYARAVRAPSVGELFSGATQSSSSLGTIGLVGAGDPCDYRSAYHATGGAQIAALCQAQGVPGALIDSFVNLAGTTPYQQVGNRELDPEIADTFTVGIVLRAPQASALLSGLSLSIDAYDIRLKGAIGYITSTTALQKCFNADGSNPSYSNSNYFCSLITRDAGSGQLTMVQNPLLNLGGYKTRGIDFALNWTVPLEGLGMPADAGRLTFNSTANYLDRFQIQTLPGAKFAEFAGTLGNTQIDAFATAHPTWKATTSLRYDLGQAGLTLKWRYIDGMENASNVGTNGTAPPISSVNYFDAQFDFKIGEDFSLNGGVLNLTDRKPPRVNTTPVGVLYTDVSTYDLVGRRFYLGIKSKF